jgi:hypothetical protein
MNENKRGFKATHKRKVASIEPSKPRNFVAKNAIGSGAGAHKDKKKAMKQGDTKHKNQEYAEGLQARLDAELAEGGFGRDAYQRDYDSSQTGFGRQGREDDEYHVPDPVDPNTLPYNVTVNGKAINQKPFMGREEALAWAKEQIAAGQLDPKVAKLSPVQYSESVAEDADEAEYSDEVGMVKNNLHTIIRVCTHLAKALDNNENLPEWIEEKISIAKGMTVTALDYMISQHEQGIQPTMEGSAVDKIRAANYDRLAKRSYKQSDKTKPGQVSVYDADKMKKGDERAAKANKLKGVAEKLNLKAMDTGAVIKDFEKSNAPQFRGKTKEKRKQMAIAAKMGAMKKKKKAAEGWTHDTLAAQLFEQELTYEDKLNSMLAKKISK